jgi:hypothetical protein
MLLTKIYNSQLYFWLSSVVGFYLCFPLPLWFIYHRSTIKYLTKLAIHETAGFNVETVEYKNISFTVWDVGGQDKVRKVHMTFFFRSWYIFAMLGVANFLCVMT